MSDSTDAQDMRRRMGQSVANLMDITDAELAHALRVGESASGRLNELLRERGLPVAHRISILLGIALAPISRELR